MVNVAMSAGDGKGWRTAKDLIKQKPTELMIPIRECRDKGDSIVCGFRTDLISVGSNSVSGGGITCGAGCGNEFITLSWKGRECVIRGSELLKAWVKTFAPEDAELFPE